jgi:capsular exopolysaccharide synthesis family protein
LPRDLADQYAKLRHHIITTCSGKVRTIAITSAAHGEGTTTVAISFAMSLALDRKLRILLVDANLRKPRLHRVIRAHQKPGVTELFTASQSFEEVLKKTTIPNVFVITSGAPIAYPQQLFEPTNLEEQLLQRTEEFDYVLLDCPPVNPCPEALSLAARSDGAILVVQAGKTHREVVRSAKGQMMGAQVNIFGVILNRRKYFIPQWLYNKL